MEGPGEVWAEQIEATGAIPAGLRSELKERGFLAWPRRWNWAGAGSASASGWA